MKKILIVAPHPDDETLGCGGLIARRISEGYTVKAVVLTKGEKLFTTCLGIHTDPSPQQVWEMRKDESRKAVAILGMDPAGLDFWTYNDSELKQQRGNVIKDLTALLKDLKPDEAYCTNGYEAHPDHRAAVSIVDDACTAAGIRPAVYHYFITLPETADKTKIIRKERTESIDVSAFTPLKQQAVNAFACHLKIMSPEQTAPILETLDDFVTGEEIFIRHH